MDQVFDPIRKKFVKLTPEEGVRQHVIRTLTGCYGYPETHLAVEYGFKYNKRQYRADVVVFNRALKPALLVECKASSVNLTMDVIDQVVRYNYVLDVPWILITNGDLFYLCRRDANGDYLQQSRMPSFDELCQI
jgi:type I site-specific restriction endonuclease